MIASIRGIVKQKLAESCVLEAGGLGYEVFLTRSGLATLPNAGESAEFFTHFHIREDAQQLFGFGSLEERKLFLLLLSVKGVGPRLGMAVLSQLGVADLVGALKTRDLGRLGSASGVGKRLAERMAVELSDKVEALAVASGADSSSGATSFQGPEARAVQALLALGIPLAQARQAVARALAQEPGILASAGIEDMVKLALKNL